MNKGKGGPFSLCWDCQNACSGCDWSRSLEPIPGWTATPTVINHQSGPEDSYIVWDCPMFKRDAIRGGQLWTDKKNVKTPKTYKRKP